MTTRDKVLEFIQKFINANGFSPTIREIRDGTGLRSTATVHGHIERLEKAGVLTWEPDKPRTIRVISETPSESEQQSS